MLAGGDTLVVQQARMESSFPIVSPYKTDSLNNKGAAWDENEPLSRNVAMVRPSQSRSGEGKTLSCLSPIAPIDSLHAQMSVLTFDLQSDKYAKVDIKVNKCKQYKLYIDGKETSANGITLTPSRVAVTLQVLTSKNAVDTFDIKVVGKDLSAVRVNPIGKRPYTMYDMLCGDHYRNASLSPSGRYLVTTLYNTSREGKTQYSTTLTDLNTNRTILRQNERAEYSWLDTEEGDLLYFTRPSADRGRELVVYNAATGEETLLADQVPEGWFSIAPNRQYLIFSLSEEGNGSKNGLKKLGDPDDRQPDWRSRNSLWRYDLKTGSMVRLTFGTVSTYLPDISADSRYLLLQTHRFDAARTPFDRTTLVRMNVETAQVDTLLADTIFISGAKFSPDGRQLLISASPAAFGGIGNEVKAGQTPNSFDYKLYLYDIDAHTTRYLLRGFAPAVDNYVWNKGDGMIYFLATDGSERPLYRLHPTTGEVTRYSLPVTYVQGFTLSSRAKRSPRIVFFGQSAERAREMFVAELSSFTPRTKRIGQIDFDKLYGDIALGTCHNWTFQASRGDTIDGFYFLPPNFDETKKYPMLVYYYGGCVPTTKCLEFQYPLQIFASMGYVVYAVNPSGCTGYGQEFAARHVNTWGEGSGDDIIEGTKQFCKEHSFVDASKIGCMGASYGGFMTEYLQTRTDLFAAAISHAGISNIASYWGGGYWGYSYGECAQYGSYPWNNPDLYVKHSSLFNADKIHTPLLLLHGTADTNVPTTESQQLYTALKILGREVTYVQVEGENHVITDYQKRMAWQNVIFAWFEKYLRGDASWWDSLGL